MEHPINVTYLLAVWSEAYIDRFMEISLPSLLASGNIPALAEHTRSRFFFLTRRQDHALFMRHHIFQRLSQSCRIEFVDIDDLVFHGNYSATLTLAYERGMRQAGEAMLSTYFVYLVADYIMADGSLINLLPHMQRGVSGITTGNFQVVEEDFSGIIAARKDKTTGILQIQPRELVALALRHLHPITVANTVNQPLSNATHANRLFWKAGEDTLVGRFYLRHMLCIKPELDHYIIGASCDYSYIPEMCPSGNVVHLADSDEYCVIEMQPFLHEQQFIENGAPEQTAIARSLSQWSTRTHRDNALYPVIYHAGEITGQTHAIVEESRAFVEGIEEQLPLTPLPARGHPYWISCIEGVLEQLALSDEVERHFKNGVFAGIVGSPVFEPPLGIASNDYNLLKIKRYHYNSGILPALWQYLQGKGSNKLDHKPWHREYRQSRAIKKTLRAVAAAHARFMIIVHIPAGYAQWAYAKFGEQAVLQKYELFTLRPLKMLQAYQASHAVIMLPVKRLHSLHNIVARCAECLTGERKLTVIVTQPWFTLRGLPFRKKISALAPVFTQPGVQLESFTVLSSPLRGLLDNIYRMQAGLLLQRSLSPRVMFMRVLILPFFIATCMSYALNNLLSRNRRYPHLRGATCAIITLKLV